MCGMDDRIRNQIKIRFGGSGPPRAGQRIAGHSSSMIQRAGLLRADLLEQFSNSV